MEEINQNQQIPQPPDSHKSLLSKNILNRIKNYWQTRRFGTVFGILILLFFAGFIGGKIWWLVIERGAYKSLIEHNIPQQMDELLKNLFQNTPTPTKITVPT